MLSGPPPGYLAVQQSDGCRKNRDGGIMAAPKAIDGHIAIVIAGNIGTGERRCSRQWPVWS